MLVHNMRLIPFKLLSFFSYKRNWIWTYPKHSFLTLVFVKSKYVHLGIDKTKIGTNLNKNDETGNEFRSKFCSKIIYGIRLNLILPLHELANVVLCVSSSKILFILVLSKALSNLSLKFLKSFENSKDLKVLLYQHQ